MSSGLVWNFWMVNHFTWHKVLYFCATGHFLHFKWTLLVVTRFSIYGLGLALCELPACTDGKEDRSGRWSFLNILGFWYRTHWTVQDWKIRFVPSSSSMGGAGGNSTCRTSAVCTLTPRLWFIPSAWETSVSERRKYGRELADQVLPDNPNST
jgi:hypothetical protein